MNELQGKRLLIVEDDPLNMAVFAVTLRQSGAGVFQDMWNTNAVENMVKYLPLDAILLDLMLRQRVSGYDIFEQIKKHELLAHIPVIIVSASDPNIEIPRAKAKGFAGYIGKPIMPRLFSKQIVSCMNGNPVWYAQDGRMEESS